MVLLKRKPVVFDQGPENLDPNTEIWVMPGSNEIFTDYESYLERYTFYSQPIFTDAVNGKSQMTFFEALVSENNSSKDIDKIFPDTLREEILRKAQFSILGRTEDLVNMIYDHFKNKFFPGDEVIVLLDGGEQYPGVIRDKANFPELRWKDGSIIRPPFSRSFVRLVGHSEETLLDDEHIKRPRTGFTKQNIKLLVKSSLQRESWPGAPWLVHEHLAVKYRIPMRIPEHVAAKIRERQAALQQSAPIEPSSAVSSGNKIRKTKAGSSAKDFDIDRLGPQTANDDRNMTEVKYPIEDLNLRLKNEKRKRPCLKFLAPQDGKSAPQTGLRMHSVGLLLEVWNTLNVHCEVFLLDSFTFDDFVDAISFSSFDIKCELLEETHCAVLKQLVNEDGELQVRLPELEADDGPSDEHDDMSDASETDTPPESHGGAETGKLSAVEIASDDNRNGSVASRLHRASEMLADYPWIDRLKKRDFVQGGWQTILVGILHQLSLDGSQKATCEAILAELAPLDQEPTQYTAQMRYTTLDGNLRVAALEIITGLTMSTKAVRSYLDSCSEDMTETRKLKVEQQRTKKDLALALGELGAQQQVYESKYDTSPPPKTDKDDRMLADDADDEILDMNNGSSDVEANDPRRLRHDDDRAAERRRKRDDDAARKERERLEKVYASKASAQEMKEYRKLMREVEAVESEMRELEEQLTLCDRDLREANCQRTMRLGTDRFFNRYYWFERNGMPFEGLPNSSTADYGYANGRIWVQGPSAMDSQGFFELDKADMNAYKQMHGHTVLERKEIEEGGTSLQSALEWGYYDKAEQVDALLAWLDDRGKREKGLAKELSLWREDIISQMDKLQDHLEQEKAKRDHPESDGESVPASRVSTRHKTYVNAEAGTQRVLRWRNGAALRELGHLHSEMAPSRGRGRGGKSGKGVPVPVQQVTKGGPRSTRSGANR